MDLKEREEALSSLKEKLQKEKEDREKSEEILEQDNTKLKTATRTLELEK